jgi:hypothetical protein
MKHFHVQIFILRASHQILTKQRSRFYPSEKESAAIISIVMVCTLTISIIHVSPNIKGEFFPVSLTDYATDGYCRQFFIVLDMSASMFGVRPILGYRAGYAGLIMWIVPHSLPYPYRAKNGFSGWSNILLSLWRNALRIGAGKKRRGTG